MLQEYIKNARDMMVEQSMFTYIDERDGKWYMADTV